MTNLFLDKTDEELKMYFEQFQAWEMLGIITDDELKEICNLYTKKLGDKYRTIFITDLLKAIAFRWLENT